MITIRLTEGKLRNIIKETLNKVFNENKSIIEIKYFHPSGKTLPNGSFYQKGGFLRECKINKESFILTEDIHDKQYNMKDYRGGIIVFSTDVNAVILHKNGFINKLKQFLTTFLQRWNKDKNR